MRGECPILKASTLAAIREHVRRFGYAPTIHELRRTLGKRSPTSPRRAIAALVRDGRLRSIGAAWARNVWPTDEPTYPELRARCALLEQALHAGHSRCTRCEGPITGSLAVATIDTCGTPLCLDCMPDAPPVESPLTPAEFAAHVRGRLAA